MNPCPTVLHASYESKEAAEAEVRSQAARTHKLGKATQCSACGWWRIAWVTP